ncbi:hypothetical protein JKP75_06495 [Blastococcus sp. TML/M2B]|uniref:hypothetical protein n=1 Tax=unclassified Blastococcus TaxID=2619396 RepID=UPI00190DC802|nr:MULTISPECIES: hypothetical protein [unclassified Blastococcus]MBN1092245.1 hypothetical protein [Blastococcus sp. TML/M2B]MBN1097654.1 hypothetical protein [Blastococcus sp. TML/C7B]
MRPAVVLIAVGLCLLAGCSSDDSASDSADSSETSSSASSGAPEDPRGVAASGDEDLIEDLCSDYCQTLMDNDQICPTGTTDLLSCSIPLAEGIDAVNDLADASEELDRSDPERYEALDDAIVAARDAYDDWSDDTKCKMVIDIQDPFWWRVSGSTEEIGRMNVFACSAKAASAGYTQSSVGAVLRNLSRS